MRPWLVVASVLLGSAGAVDVARAREQAAPEVLCPPPPAPEDDPRDARRRRELADNIVLTPALFDSSEISRSIGLRTAATSDRVINVDFGQLRDLDLTQFVVAEVAEVSIALNDWLAIIASGFGRGAIATNVEGLVVRGASELYGGALGANVALFHPAHTPIRISARAAGGYAAGHVITPFPLLTRLVDSPAATVEDIITGESGELLVSPTHRWSARAGVNAAWAMTSSLAVQGTLGATYEWQSYDISQREDVELDLFSPEAGIALSADGRPLGLPVALMAEYLFTYAHRDLDDGDWQDDHLFALGLYYTGVSYMQAGLIGTLNLATGDLETEVAGRALRASEERNDLGGALVLRAFW